MRASVLLVFLALVAASFAAVIKLDSSNFDDHVGGPKACFVKFFAPWCGHCKALAPTWEELAEQYATSPKVEVAEVDCTTDQEICNRFGVQGYPTIKMFPKASKVPMDYQGGRTIEDLSSFLTQNADAKPVVFKRSLVVSLTGADFDEKVKAEGKSTLVKFFAPWCGHCKKLAPEYDKVAAAFSREPNAQIVEVDCDANSELCGRFGVQGYPTIKFFAPAAAEPIDYEGDRTAQAIVDFVNEKVGLIRNVDGTLKPEAGRISELDEIAAKFVAADNKPALVLEAKVHLDKLTGVAAKNAKYYVKVMEKLIENPQFVAKESARLASILAGSINESKIDDFTIRSNILAAFL